MKRLRVTKERLYSEERKRRALESKKAVTEQLKSMERNRKAMQRKVGNSPQIQPQFHERRGTGNHKHKVSQVLLATIDWQSVLLSGETNSSPKP
jgi:hypothetical protein